jgi:flagellar basal-body rod protein FlgG
MIDSLYIAITGLHAQQTRIDTISNNLANVNTPGFKKARVSFEDLVYRPMTTDWMSTPGVADVERNLRIGGLGTFIARTEQDFSQGDLRQTQRSLDFAIQGQGFFQVEMEDGSTAYTRQGSFSLDPDGGFVTATGQRLLPAIRVPSDATQVAVSRSGIVTALVPQEDQPIEIGRIELANFLNAGGLRAIGSGLYQATEASGEAFVGEPQDLGLGRIEQGFVEASNVDFVEELSEVVLAQRAYQLNARALQAADEILGEINNLRR